MSVKFTAGTNTFENATGLKTGQDLEDLIELAQPTSNLVDDASLEVYGSTDKRLRVKDGGISGAMLADDAVATIKIADDAVITAKIADANVTTVKIADGAVTNVKLGNDIILVPAGAVMPFAMNSAPTGWLEANGATVSRTDYAALFSAIGTTFGAGDGSTTFKLPDLRGIFVRGSGTNTNGTAAAFGVYQEDTFKAHNHPASGTVGVQVFNGTGNFPDNNKTVASGGSTGLGSSSRTSVTITTSNSGGSETRPRNMPLLYCIKY